MRYSPYVILNPLSALTHNYSVGWEGGEGGLDQILTSPVRLESSALVFSFSSRGDGLAGCHLAAVMPSQGFDQLAPDFNHGLLVLILVGLAAVVVAMREVRSFLSYTLSSTIIASQYCYPLKWMHTLRLKIMVVVSFLYYVRCIRRSD